MKGPLVAVGLVLLALTATVIVGYQLTRPAAPVTTAGPLPEHTPPRLVDADLIISNVTVIDVVAGRAAPDRAVAVKGDRIVAVLPTAVAVAPADARVIDGTGKYIIPGLWDMHAHLADPSFPAWFLRYGVTGLRHMFGANPFYQYARPTAPTEPHPRVLVAQHLLDGPDTVFTWPANRNVVTALSAKAARAAVREIKDKRNDFLKVYSALPREAYFAALEESRAVGLAVAGHVPRSLTVAEASDAGQHTIEHLDGVALQCSTLEDRHHTRLRGGNGFGKGFDAATGWRVYLEAHETFDPDRADRLFKKFVANGTWHVPTLTQTRQMARLADPDAIPASVERELPVFLATLWKRQITPSGVSVAFPLSIRLDRTGLAERERLFRGDQALVGRMHRAGVGLLAGTDATAPLVVPGLALHDELALLVEAGLTPTEALRTATINPARCLKMEGQVGCIEAGLFADLVVLAKNPLEDITNTRSIEVVIAGGRVVPR